MRIKLILLATIFTAMISCSKTPKKILIIGDSISIGYTPHVKELLGDRAIVVHNPGNAQHTGTGLEKVVEWIGDEDWDVIQFNWGLWDLAYRNPTVNNQGNRDKINGKVTFTPEQYQTNLDSLVRIIQSASNARLLFVTTSYVPEGEAGRFVKDGEVYNQAALEVMDKFNIPITDLYQCSKEIHPDFGTASDNVHYTSLGYRQLAKKVIEGLSRFDKSFLKRPKTEIIKAHPNQNNQGLLFGEAVKEAEIIRSLDPDKDLEIVLQAGTHYLKETIVLGPTLNHLKISGSTEGEVFVKGAKRLKVSWAQEDKQLTAMLPQMNQIHQLFVDGRKQILARYPDYYEQGGHWQGHAPDAISKERLASWRKPEGAFIHAMHGSEWGDFHYAITGIDEDGNPILAGGHQNNRSARMHDRYRMVENVFEELSSPGEFFFDEESKKLFWYPDQSDQIESVLEIPILKELIILKGEKSNPVEDIEISGIQFSQSLRTFMEEYEPLLRSDWTIYRGGALLISNAENCKINTCEFKELGGNGIFISGYNRGIRIEKNHIHDLGASGVALVGMSSAVRSPSFEYSEFVPFEELDTIRGPKTDEYPSECVIDNNLIYRIGRIEKQVAGVQISMAMNITVSHNSIYDVPRAGINISEGTWGGHIIEFNDVFMTVQESGDHGSFNSWGRDRFWHPNRSTMDELNAQDPQMPLWDAIHTTIIRNNRFRCDHGWDIDLDDGSTNYEIYNNLCLNGGIKLREGFYRKVENNIMINNGFHPHVWFVNSGDIFRKNIVMTKHKDIRLSAWGEEVDYNLFADKESLEDAHANGTDRNSLAGNPDFRDPENGDFMVSPTSPALALGFENFDMSQFGVQEPKLKALRQEPENPALLISQPQKSISTSREWLGAKIKNVETLGERSASGLPDETGVLIVEVNTGSLADQASLKSGDIIISAENLNIKTVDELVKIHQGNNWKGKLNLKIFRDQQTLEVVLSTK